MAAGQAEARIVPTTPKQRQRRDRIIAAARSAFAENSFDDVLMEEVARVAGVGKGTIYRYFPDKESLYFAVIFQGIDELKQQIRAALMAPGQLEPKIRELITTLVSFFHRNRLFFRLMNLEDNKVGDEGHPNRRRWRRERGELVDGIAAALEHGRDMGAFEAVYPRAEAQILLGMVRSVLRHNEEGLGPEEMADEIARVFFRGIGRR